ncbi:MAG: hypothetical protein M3Y28_09500 [Armatimonadota bacterium]|nr:hypothetical protein [Armatimonadota bacterium]
MNTPALILMKIMSHAFSRPRRAAAFLLAFLCFWMATVGLAHHTDLLVDHGSSSSRTVLSHFTAFAAADDLCAACQWTQTVQPSGFSVCAVPTPRVSLSSPSFAAVSALQARPFRPSSPRAPPVSLLPKLSSLFA